jgi:phage shock protein PspC (stress-responsive transcriptional regulator)
MTNASLPKDNDMTERQPNLFTRDDTFLGICEGLGEDLGINSNLLRVALALLLFINPIAAAVTYAVAGVAVLASRLLFPKPRVAQSAEAAPRLAPANEQAEPLPLAA